MTEQDKELLLASEDHMLTAYGSGYFPDKNYAFVFGPSDMKKCFLAGAAWQKTTGRDALIKDMEDQLWKHAEKVVKLEENLRIATGALERICGISGEPTHGPFSMENISVIGKEALERLGKGGKE